MKITLQGGHVRLHLALRFRVRSWADDSKRINLYSDQSVGTLKAENIADMRILIVEDEPDLLRSLARALREEGYAVDTAADG